MTTYVDSSVILRRVLGEPNPLADWPDIEAITSELARVECLRAVERLRAIGAFSDTEVSERRTQILDALTHFQLVPLLRTILERAADPFPVYVATLDALHLATAVELRADYDDLTFATHDVRLAAVARAMGFAVIGT